jgi:hypothetical protein
VEKKVAHPASERRVTGIALKYWYDLRASRERPESSDVAGQPKEELAPHLFIVTPDKDGESYRFAGSCSTLKELCNGDPAGRKVGETLPRMLRDRAESLMATAFKIGKPLADCGHFTEWSGADVFYRSVYMPLADAKGRPASLLGAISFKRQPLASLTL